MTGQAAEDTVQFQRTLVKHWSRGLLGVFLAAGTFAAPTGDLLPEVAVLAGSHGTQQRAIEWEALPPGPFLRMGTLNYGAIAPLPNTIE